MKDVKWSTYNSTVGFLVSGWYYFYMLIKLELKVGSLMNFTVMYLLQECGTIDSIP